MNSIDVTNFKNLDLNLLRILDALLTTGSTIRAGEEVGLSQPAISSALGRLRTALGDPLFVRHGRGIVATDYAASLRAPLRTLLEQAEAVFQGPPLFDPATASATFRITASDYFAELLMPRLAGALLASAPGVRVHHVGLIAGRHLQSIEDKSADIALIPDTGLPNWADHRPLISEEFVVVARRGNTELEDAGLRPGDTVPIDLFCEMQHATYSPEGRAQTMGDAALARIGRRRNNAVTLPVFSGVYTVVAQTGLIALLPRRLAETARKTLPLEIYAPPMHIDRVELNMVWHRRTAVNPGHAWLRACIASAMNPTKGTLA